MQETGFNPWVGKIPWRRERLPTPVCWPGEFHGLYSPWGHKQSDTTERPSLHFTYNQHNDFSPHYGSHPQRIRAPFSKTSAFATKINSECPLPSWEKESRVKKEQNNPNLRARQSPENTLQDILFMRRGTENYHKFNTVIVPNLTQTLKKVFFFNFIFNTNTLEKSKTLWLGLSILGKLFSPQ